MTSIEWLYEKLRKSDRRMHESLLEQAKEMHKQEIIDAHKADLYPCSDEDSEQYYNETFKKD